MKKTNPVLVSVEGFDSKLCFDKNENIYDRSRCALTCCIIAYMFHDYNSALEYAEICKLGTKTMLQMYLYPIFLFYDGLVLLELAKSPIIIESKKQDYFESVKRNITKLRKMSKKSPQNYCNKVYLLEAELSVAEGNVTEALSFYQQAITLSDEYGNFLHECALAHERKGICCLDKNSFEQAKDSLTKSCALYKKWGAKAKMNQLIQKYPFLKNSLQNTSSVNMELNIQERSMASVSLITFSSDPSSLSKHKRKVPY